MSGSKGSAGGASEFLVAARNAIRVGVSVIPVDDRTKQPSFRLLPRDPETGKAIWNPYRTRFATDEELTEWFQPAQGTTAGRQVARAMAAVCGNQSGGLTSIDFDIVRFYEAWCRLVGNLADGLPVQRTGGGRFQVFFRCPGPGPNQDLAWAEDPNEESGRTIGIQTRGEGGYANLPPSWHPKRTRYEWVRGDLGNIPMLAQAHADALIAAARKLDECPQTRKERERIEAEARQTHERKAKAARNGSASVIDAFNDAHPVEDVLERHGYTPCGDRFVRPGGSSASVSIKDGTSCHFSGNDPLNDGKVRSGIGVHDAFDVYTHFEHGGDVKNAVKAAAELLGLGYSKDTEEGGDREDKAGGGTPRPKVFVPGGAVPVSHSAKRLGELLAKTGRYYLWGGQAVTLDRHADGSPLLTPVKPASLPSAFEGVAIIRTFAKEGGAPIEVAGTFSEQAGKLVLHADAFRRELPVIRLLARCPVLIEREGELVQVCGFDLASGVLAEGSPAEEMSLAQAVPLLSGLLDGFCFATSADRSRALAAIITPSLIFGRLLGGRAPLDLGEADQSQTGKGYRNKLTAAIYRDTVKAVAPRKGGVGSLEESFNSHLVRGANFVCLDNVRGKVDSPGIESFLTEDSYSARVPYQGAVEIDPRRVVVQMTSNKADLTVDLANRCSCVRLLKRDEGFAFPVYPEGDVLAHVRANQPRYLGAVFAVARAWHAAGRPGTAEGRHDFRVWARSLDWIVQNLFKATPLLDGHREAQTRMATPAVNWLRDVALAVRRAGRLGERLRAHDLVDLLVDQGDVEVPGLAGGDDPADERVRSKVLQAVGRKLSACFKSGDATTVEGMVIRRQAEHDAALRRDTRSYVFEGAPMRDPAEQRIGALIGANAPEQPSDAAEATPEPAGCAYDEGFCAYGAPIGVSVIGADSNSLKSIDLPFPAGESAPNAPMGSIHCEGKGKSGVSPSIYTGSRESIGALGAIGAPPPASGTLRDTLPPDLLEAWEERVAICVIDGGLTEAEAEAIAYQQIREQLNELHTGATPRARQAVGA